MKLAPVRCYIAAVLCTASAPAVASDILVLRDTIAHFAQIEDLCTRDPSHSDCSIEQRELVCSDLRVVGRVSRNDEPADEADFELRLVSYVAGVMFASDCTAVTERGTPDEDRDALFGVALLERHTALRELAAAVKSDLDQRSGRVRHFVSNLRKGTATCEQFAMAHEDSIFTADGRPIAREKIVQGICVALSVEARSMIAEYSAFSDDLGETPAARYDLEQLGANAFNNLSRAWEALLAIEDCAELVPTRDSWRIGLHTVKPGEGLTLPADPATRLVGAGVESADTRVSGSLDELGHLLTSASEPRREGVCATLARRLDERFVPAWTEIHRVSRTARYHFVNERAHQLDLLREAYDATTVLRDNCESDADPTPWREDYLRHAVAFVELLDPPLASTLSRYLGSRYDVDMGHDR